jgi:hypothetical protein
MFPLLLNARRKFHGQFVGSGIDPIAVSIYGKLLHAWELQDDPDEDFVTDLHSGLVLENFNAMYGSAAPMCDAYPTYTSYEFSPGTRSAGPQSLALVGHVDMACSFWARRTGSFVDATGGFIFAERNLGESNPSNSQVEIIARPDGRFVFQWESTGAGDNYNVQAIATPFQVDETHFLACSRDAANKQISFYVDGALDSAPTYTVAPTGGSSAKTWIGNYDAQNANFEGRLAGVWVYSQQLTADEVAWLYNSGAGRNYAELLTLAGL